MKANMNPRTGTKMIKNIQSRTRHNPFVGLRMAYPSLCCYATFWTFCLSVCLFVWCQEESYGGGGGGGLCAVSVYRQNKCDKHSTVLQIKTAPNKSPEYLHQNSNCINKCVSQVSKNVDSYEYYQWSSHTWIGFISTSLNFEYQCRQCYMPEYTQQHITQLSQHCVTIM
jgi:hypothetical protein